MGKTLGPEWSKEQVAAGQRFAESWKDKATGTEPAIGPEAGKVSAVLARHQASLMGLPHVVAVSEGRCRADGRACILVFVDRLVDDVDVPDEVEGVPVEVVESGRIDALPK